MKLCFSFYRFPSRHEADTIIWAGATLWVNQGEGKFSPRSLDFGSPPRPPEIWMVTETLTLFK